MTIQWNLQSRSIKELSKHPKNPRTLTKEQYRQLKKSIDTFGLIDKIIINTNNQIIGGHQRFEVLKKDKVSKVECWVPDRTLTEKEVEELLLRLNRNHGDFDYDMLANSFDVPDLLDYGFSIDELELTADNIEDVDTNEAKEDPIKNCPHCGGIL
jgi:ParB-like chromosome segregation protein Spo0J